MQQMFGKSVSRVQSTALRYFYESSLSVRSCFIIIIIITVLFRSEYVPYWKRLSQEERAKMDERLTLDGSGTFHWRESCLLEEVTMTKEDVATLTGTEACLRSCGDIQGLVVLAAHLQLLCETRISAIDCANYGSCKIAPRYHG